MLSHVWLAVAAALSCALTVATADNVVQTHIVVTEASVHPLVHSQVKTFSSVNCELFAVVCSFSC